MNLSYPREICAVNHDYNDRSPCPYQQIYRCSFNWLDGNYIFKIRDGLCVFLRCKFSIQSRRILFNSSPLDYSQENIKDDGVYILVILSDTKTLLKVNKLHE